MATTDVTKLDSGPSKITYRATVDAPVAELFAQVADPRRHGELDGSGTVLDLASGPDRLSAGAKFSIKMKRGGIPYRITSKVSDFEENRVVEWRHPAGHRWRWEFEALSPSTTQVTETWDFSRRGPLGVKVYALMGFPRANASAIKKTLTKLQARYAA